MKFRKLGNTNIDVSLICLGTMTWGEQNTEKEAFEQMNIAVEKGINFLIQLNFIQCHLKKKRGVQLKQLLETGSRKRKIEKK